MRVLFDLVTVSRVTGAGEFVRRVAHGLMEEAGSTDIVFAYDSRRISHAYPDLEPELLESRGYEVVDVAEKNIAEIADRHAADIFFIGCAQFWTRVQGIEDVRCRVVCVIHDLAAEEKSSSFVELWAYLWEGKARFLYHWLLNSLRIKDSLSIQPLVNLSHRNNQVQFIAVSEYTRTSLHYHYGIPKEKISVVYSPERLFAGSGNIENAELRNLVESGKRFYLIVNAGKRMKNAGQAIRAFKRFAAERNDICLVTVGSVPKAFEGHVTLPFLCESDLEQAYANCYALVYPSLFEGFGYPPMEAMKYSKPVLCSNVCSMPEILESAPLYFSPFYTTDIYRSLELLDDRYSSLEERSAAQYAKIKNLQQDGLHKLLDMLRSGNL